jgi:mono/diheme cytochrome c family protein
MMMPKPWLATAAAAFAAVVVAAPAFAADTTAPAAAPGPDAALIARGKYLTTAGDCAACHTAPNGPQFAGGLYMDTPFGPISTPNITPDKDTGIGNITDDQFYRVFHQGIGMKGEPLYPVMPYPWFTKVTRDDVLAIKAYLFSLQPVHAPRKPLKLIFPFNIRDALYAWDAVFFKEGTFKPNPSESPQVNRGAYLVQGLEHCGECHNGNNLLGDTSWAQNLRGGPIDNWYAPNITSDKKEGIGKYTDADIYQYLKTGSNPAMGVVVGPMSQTMHESLRKLTDEDLHDIVLYLKSTPPKEGFKETKPNTASVTYAVNADAYLNYCASCHGQNGKGLGNSVPALAGNGAVTAGGPETVIRVILGGIDAQTSYSAMPAIGARMTDQEVADAANYVRASWGNDAPATAGPGLVGTLRKDTRTVLAFNAPGGCPKIADQATEKVIDSPDAQNILKATTEENLLQNADKLINLVKAGAPQASQSAIINSLTLGYCPVVAANKNAATQAQKSELLDEFAERIYTQIASNGQD